MRNARCDDHRGEERAPADRKQLLNVRVAEGDDDVHGHGGEKHEEDCGGDEGACPGRWGSVPGQDLGRAKERTHELGEEAAEQAQDGEREKVTESRGHRGRDIVCSRLIRSEGVLWKKRADPG